MPSIFWDTNLFIYLLEGRSRELRDSALRARERMLEEGDQLVTSALSLGETMVQPLRAGNPTLARRYLELVSSGAIIVPLDQQAATRYAEIRARNPSVKPPDALQLACAAQHGVAVFLTNDRRLGRLRIRGIGQVAALRDWTA